MLLPLLILYLSMFGILVEVTCENFHFETFFVAKAKKNVNSDFRACYLYLYFQVLFSVICRT